MAWEKENIVIEDNETGRVKKNGKEKVKGENRVAE